MPDPSQSGFIVVECQEPPNQNNKHVCVPKTWVTKKITERRVSIAYPTEDQTRIAIRINNKEPANKLWPLYIGDIKYEADSYENAVVGFLQTMHGDTNKQDKNIEIEPVVELKDPLKIRIVLPKHTPKSDKKKKSEKTSPKEHSTNKIKKIKHKNLQKLSVCQEKGVPKSLESKVDDIINSASQNYVKQLTNNLNDKNNAESFERKLNSITDLMEKDIDFTNSNFSPKDTQLLIQAQTKMNGFFKFIRDMLEDVKKMYIEAQETKKTLNHIVSKYNLQQTLATVTEEKDKKHQNNGISLLKETEQDKMECEADNKMENDIKAYEENSDSFIIKEEDLFNEQDTDMENISDNEIFTDGESSLESTPPPSSDVKRKENYNKKDSTWTLKHRHPGKGLIQLGHGVYISAKGLEEAKKTSKDVRTFTRHLFREVFTKEALENCSMTGSKPSFGRHVDVVRPALHNHARTVIFTYAMNYSRDVNWKNIKLSELVHSLRCMLQNNRRDRRRGRLMK